MKSHKRNGKQTKMGGVHEHQRGVVILLNSWYDKAYMLKWSKNPTKLTAKHYMRMEPSWISGSSASTSYLVAFGIGHVFCFHSAVLRRLAGELHEEEQLLKDGRVHDLQVLRSHADGLQQGGNRGTNTAHIDCGMTRSIFSRVTY